jgi:hypothetical protein
VGHLPAKHWAPIFFPGNLQDSWENGLIIQSGDYFGFLNVNFRWCVL